MKILLGRTGEGEEDENRIIHRGSNGVILNRETQFINQKI
jgi:hypothetical protein